MGRGILFQFLDKILIFDGPVRSFQLVYLRIAKRLPKSCATPLLKDGRVGLVPIDVGLDFERAGQNTIDVGLDFRRVRRDPIDIRLDFGKARRNPIDISLDFGRARRGPIDIGPPRRCRSYRQGPAPNKDRSSSS